MNINIDGAKNVAVKAFMKVRKISPELALAGGIACGIAAIVVGCMASRHVDDIVEETQSELDDLQNYIEEDKIENPKKELFKAYVKAGWKFTKLYAPTIALATTSTALILASHGILKKRYVGTVAAYNALDEAFKGYRKRVADILGEDAEKIVMNGGSTEKNIKVKNDDDSEETVKGNSIVFNDKKNSPYEFDFNRHTAPLTWQASPDYNDAFLRAQQNYFNDILNARGHVFLNEVLDALGLKRTPAGQVCGWYKGAGDDYIDFGYMEVFIRDYNTDSDLCKKNIHLNFNCDGSIWDMI